MKYLRFRFWIICFICSYTTSVNAFWLQKEEAFIRKISFAEGLNTQVIYDLYVDDKGLLFLGTNKGLITYNGVFFNTYGFQNNLALSVNKIQQDKQGVIWCKNFSNQIFYAEKDTLKPYLKINHLLKEEDANLVDFTFIDNTLYVLTEKSLIFENDEGSFTEVISFQEDDNQFFFSLFLDEIKQKLFVSSDEDIKVIINNKVVGKYKTPIGQKEIAYFNDDLYFIKKGSENKLYANNTLIPFVEDQAKRTYFYNLAQSANNHWLCTSNGLYEIDTKTKAITNNLLRNYQITDIVQDKEGNYWISSLDNGLFFMPNIQMKRLLLNIGSRHQNIKSIAADSLGNIYAGTSKGEIFKLNKDLDVSFTYTTKTNMEVEYIYPYQNKLITSAGLFNHNQSLPIIDAYFGKGVAEDEFGNFIIANYNLAGLIPKSLTGKPSIPENIENKPFIEYNTNTLEVYIFRNKRARVVQYSKQQKAYYVGFSDGLFRFGLDGSVFEIKTAKNTPIIAGDLYESPEGFLWVASTQDGLFCINQYQVIKHFNSLNGLSNDKCKKIQADNDGIWVITDQSLDYYNFKTQRLQNYGNNLGLNGLSINDFYVDKNYIWFATNEGLIYFPKDIVNHNLSPHFEIYTTQNDGLQLHENALIPYSKNNLVVEFKSILYKSLGNYDFEYKLEPFHKEWQSQNAKQNKLNFVALKPNTYNLKARIKTGSIITPEINYPFIVDEPFWLKLWFISLVVLLLSLLFVLVYKWAVLKTKKQQNIKEKLAISQLTALRSQMNPHFMFNVLNAIQGLIYSNQKNKANEYIGTFSTLMRKTLDVSGQREVSIEEEIETIKLYISLEKARFDEDEFEYEILLPDEDLRLYSIPSLIIQPFVENAIKHGLLHKRGLKKLHFKLNKKDKFYWQFSIEDNGVGRKASQYINQKIKKNHTSFATNAIETRIQLINKLSDYAIEIEIEDLNTNQNKPKGTRVILNIPIKRVTE